MITPEPLAQEVDHPYNPRLGTPAAFRFRDEEHPTELMSGAEIGIRIADQTKRR